MFDVWTQEIVHQLDEIDQVLIHILSVITIFVSVIFPFFNFVGDVIVITGAILSIIYDCVFNQTALFQASFAEISTIHEFCILLIPRKVLVLVC